MVPQGRGGGLGMGCYSDMLDMSRASLRLFLSLSMAWELLVVISYYKTSETDWWRFSACRIVDIFPS